MLVTIPFRWFILTRKQFIKITRKISCTGRSGILILKCIYYQSQTCGGLGLDFEMPEVAQETHCLNLSATGIFFSCTSCKDTKEPVDIQVNNPALNLFGN